MQFTFREFLDFAEKLNEDARSAGSESTASPYLIGSILNSWMAVESFVNNMMDDFASLPANKFSIHERGFLEERQVRFETAGQSAGKFVIATQSDYKRLEDKIMFLIAKFGDGKLNKGDQLWQTFESVKQKRNRLSHYRRDSDFHVTEQDSREAIDMAKQLINFLSRKIWRRPIKW